MKREPSNGEILETLQDFTEVFQEFATGVDRQFHELKTDVRALKTDVHELKTDVRVMKTEITGIKSQMVTKSYLDDKLADQKGSLVNMLRKEDQKVNRLITVLADRKVLSTPDAKDILSFRVFP